MFQINKYLQFRNTPDGKPRVLVEGEDYDLKCKHCLWLDGDDFSQTNDFIDSYFEKVSLADCRPLLTDGDWTCGDIDFKRKFIEDNFYDIWAIVVYSSLWYSWQKSFFGWFNGQRDETYDTQDLGSLIRTDEKLTNVSFFDNPAKYSKLLWDCSEEEGWSKVFKFLGIEK